jgi:hypothetical protein
VVGSILYLAVVVTHQLSPVLVIASVTALLLAGQRFPPWILLAMVLVEIWWTLLAWSELSERANLLEPDPTRTPTPPGNPDFALAGVELARYAQVAVLCLMLLLAARGALRLLRAGSWDGRPIVLIGTPVFVGLVQTYGGESLLRAFLFGLPWLAYLAAVGCVPAPGASVRRSVVAAFGLLAATAAVGACFLVAFFGRELENRVTPDDVAAARWIESKPPAERSTVRADPSLPNRLTAGYPRNAPPPALILTSDPDFWTRPFDALAMGRLAERMRTLHGRDVYLIMTPSEEANARLYGLAPPGSFDRLSAALARSTQFTLVFRHGRSSIYRVKRLSD